jgi:serine/threonine protein kinase
MSEIYLAHQTGIAGFNKLVVIKTILPDIGGEEDFVRMFLDEARTTAAFNHPNIAQVFELDTDEDQLYMAMEFVGGCTLVEMARACRQAKEAIPIGFTLGAVRDTALALHYAHNFTDARGRKQTVIHRDVAEKNIMVTYEGVTKLLDFGIAKASGRAARTSIGMVKGTSGYMSPEQIRGEPLDARSDIFSLGVVLHECLTGLRLFHGKNPEDGMIAALREDVSPPSKWNPQVSPEIDAVALKSLRREREARYTTALEFARAIDRAAPGLIWHPEQSSELVTRHFSERREETRRLLGSATFGSEATSEVRVESVIAKVKAAAAEPRMADGRRQSHSSLPPVPSAPNRPLGTPSSAGYGESITAPKPMAPASLDTTTAPAMALPGRADPSPTPPLPPRVSSAAPPSSIAAPPAPSSPFSSAGGFSSFLSPAALIPPAANVVKHPSLPPPIMTPAQSARTIPVQVEDDEDDSDAKTIPAAALPDEIRAIQQRMMAAAPKKNAGSPLVGPPVASSAPPPPPPPQRAAFVDQATDRTVAPRSVERQPERQPERPPERAAANPMSAMAATSPPKPSSIPMLSPVPQVQVVTEPTVQPWGQQRSAPATEPQTLPGDEEDVGVKTTVARRNRVGGLRELEREETTDHVAATESSASITAIVDRALPHWRQWGVAVAVAIAVAGIGLLLIFGLFRDEPHGGEGAPSPPMTTPKPHVK